MDILEKRAAIEKIDGEIVALLAQRFELSQAIGQLKAIHHQPIVDCAREDYLKKIYQQLAQQYQLDFAFLEQLFGCILVESKRLQGIAFQQHGQ